MVFLFLLECFFYLTACEEVSIGEVTKKFYCPGTNACGNGVVTCNSEAGNLWMGALWDQAALHQPIHTELLCCAVLSLLGIMGIKT